MTSTRHDQLTAELAQVRARAETVQAELQHSPLAVELAQLQARSVAIQAELNLILRAAREAVQAAERKERETKLVASRAVRSAYYRARQDRLRDFCADCDLIILERQRDGHYNHDYVCWVCGEDDAGRWSWDEDRGIVICGSGTDVGEEYVECATVAQEMMPELAIGDFDPKSCYPCTCQSDMGKAWHNRKDRVTDDLDLTEPEAEIKIEPVAE